MNVRPYQKENAIKVVAFTLELTRELSESEISDIDSVVDHVSYDLGHKERINSISVKIEQGQPAQRQAEGLAGFKYSSDDSNEPEWLLIIRDNQIAAVCRKYTSWTEISSRAKELLENSLDKLSTFADIRVSASGLQYLDQFLIEGDGDWKESLFRKDSKFLPSYVFELDDYWHTHNGYLGTNDEVKVLNNFNLNYRKEEGGSTDELALVVQHRCLNNQISLKDAIGRFAKDLDYMHQENKLIFGELFSDEILESIKFERDATK